MRRRCRARPQGGLDPIPLEPRFHDPLLSCEEAAELLGRSVRTLENWRRTGKGPEPYRISSRFIMYRTSAVEAWVAGWRVDPETGVLRPPPGTPALTVTHPNG